MTSHIQTKVPELDKMMLECYLTNLREKLGKIKALLKSQPKFAFLDKNVLKKIEELGLGIEVFGSIVKNHAINDLASITQEEAAAAAAQPPAPAAELPGQLTIDDVAQADERKAV